MQHRCPVRPVHRSQGQPAVAVDYGGQPLGQLRFPPAGAEKGIVGVTVDVQKAGGQGPPGGVNNLMGRDISQVATAAMVPPDMPTSPETAGAPEPSKICAFRIR